MAGVVTTIGPLGAVGWGSAPGALGGFGGQGFLVLPPLPVLPPVPGGTLLLPRRRPAALLSHMETLIEAPDGYSLGVSSSLIPSGRSLLPGLSGRVQVPQRFWRKRYSYPSARSHSSTARRRSWPMSSRSSKLPGMPPSHWGLLWRAAWGWGCGQVLPASSQFTIGALDGVVLGWLLRWVLQHWTGSAAGAGQRVVVEVDDATGCAALLVGRKDSLMRESWSVHLLHGRGAVRAMLWSALPAP